MPTDGPVPTDSPLMKAWEAYKRTEDYENTRKWAQVAYYTDGSLWAAFVRGWRDSYFEALREMRAGADDWRWVQPKDTAALKERLRIARDETQPHREYENLCACALAEITRLEERDRRLGAEADRLTQTTEDKHDICGFCGKDRANKMPHPVRWPGEETAGTPLVHSECEDEECGRAHRRLSDDQRADYLRGL